MAAHARRLSQPRHGEVWLATDGLSAGDTVTFAYTPSDGDTTGTTCVSDPYTFAGIPLGEPMVAVKDEAGEWSLWPASHHDD